MELWSVWSLKAEEREIEKSKVEGTESQDKNQVYRNQGKNFNKEVVINAKSI